MKLVDKFRNITVVNLGVGDSIFFWLDKWYFLDSHETNAERFPRLLSFVLNSKTSVSQVYETQELSSLFYLPLSNQAFEEFNIQQQALVTSPLSSEHDVWTYPWGSEYKAK